MYLEIVTPDVKAFEGEITGVKVPGVDGSFEILNNHASIISTLEKGEVRVQGKGIEKTFTIDSGIVEMLDNKIVILAETILN